MWSAASGALTTTSRAQFTTSFAVLGWIVMTTALASGLSAQAPRVPLVKGLTVVSALHSPDGDRENVVVVTAASDAGVRYTWSYEETAGSEAKGAGKGRFSRFVRASDLAGAPRIDQVFMSRGSTESPGFTAFTISRSVFEHVRNGERVSFTITDLQGAGAVGAALGSLGAMLTSRVTLRGTLALASPRTDSIAVLLDGKRVRLPALHFAGHFHSGKLQRDVDYWVSADSTHALILRVATGPNVLQTIRIDLPAQQDVEHELAKKCRADLPGIYFGFNSAALDPASTPALANVARLLARHPDWQIAIEGHTDSIGGSRANQTLSERRAEAVRTALVAHHHVAAARLRAVGYGAARPRESNATLEGRARNRRVELVRACAADPASSAHAPSTTPSP